MNARDFSSIELMGLLRFNRRLAEFVNEAFKDEFNHMQVSMDLTLGLVSETTMTNMEMAFHYEAQSSKARKPVTPQKSEQYLKPFEMYAKYIGDCSISTVAEVRPVSLDLLSTEQVNKVLDELGLKFAPVPLLDENNDPVIKAWNNARRNRQRAVQRVGAFYFLASQYNRHLPIVNKDAVDTEQTNASRYLFSLASDMRLSELKFATLLGGEALAITRADVVRDSFGPDTSVIQYLQQDERHPSSYMSATAEGLRKKVLEYAGL